MIYTVLQGPRNIPKRLLGKTTHHDTTKDTACVVDRKAGLVTLAVECTLTPQDEALTHLTAEGVHAALQANQGKPHVVKEVLEAVRANRRLVSGKRPAVMAAELGRDCVRATWMGDVCCLRLRHKRLTSQTAHGVCLEGPHAGTTRMGPQTTQIQTTRFDLRRGDRLLMCGGGLRRRLSSGRLIQLLGGAADASSIADAIVCEAQATTGQPTDCVVALMDDEWA